MKIHITYSVSMMVKMFFILLTVPVTGQDYRINPGCFEKMTVTNEKGVNSKELETFPALKNDTLFFVKGKDNGKDLQIVKAEENTKDGWENTVEVGKDMNSPYYEGPFVWDQTTESWYITRSNFDKKQ